MRFLSRAKDGGSESTVTGFWLAELKRLFSVVLLRFGDGSRDQYHSHAFGSLSWVLKGNLMEEHLDGKIERHRPSWRPVVTHRSTFHRVFSDGTTWVISFRGPWSRTWMEYDPMTDATIHLGHGRVPTSRPLSLHFNPVDVNEEHP